MGGARDAAVYRQHFGHLGVYSQKYPVRMLPVSQQEKRWWYFLASVYLAGAVGFATLGDWFWRLSWFSLLLSVVVLAWQLPAAERSRLAPRFGLAAALGFGAELIGVNWGWLFGRYHYGAALGWKLGGVPLMIGVNWALLSYCVSQTWRVWVKNAPNWVYLVLTPAALVGFDFLMEQVCYRYDLWYFSGGVAGLKNYVDWFLVGLIITEFTGQSFRRFDQPLARWVLVFQLLFFVFLNLLNLKA